MARSMPLPRVEGKNPPYVCACKNPNGAYSVGAFRCSSGGGNESAPRVALLTPNAEYVGIFGDFEELTLYTDHAQRVYIQSLICGEAVPLTGCCRSDRIVLTHHDLQSVYPAVDSSENAVIIKIEYEA